MSAHCLPVPAVLFGLESRLAPPALTDNRFIHTFKSDLFLSTCSCSGLSVHLFLRPPVPNQQSMSCP